jgi:uncharacterized protein YbbC (DUF1343 family)
VSDSVDAATGLPVTSLYGHRFAPDDDTHNRVDVFVFEIQDIGARFYTYIWTLYHLMEAASNSGQPVWILDRPNPIGGNLRQVEGPILKPRHFSFLGRHPIPIRYGLTQGELARYWQATVFPTLDLSVVAMDDWHGRPHWPAIGVEWGPPSPAMPDYLSALFFPGTCLFEGTNLSVGRGTSFPFQVVGAPWLNASALTARIGGSLPPGVKANPVSFTPGTGIHQGQRCLGIHLSVTDPEAVMPVALGLLLLAAIRELAPHDLSWCRYRTAANPTGEHHLDRLLGDDLIRSSLENGERPSSEWTAVGDWAERVRPFLLYPD